MSKVKFSNRFFCLLLAVIVMLGFVPSATVSAYDWTTGSCAQVTQSTDVFDIYHNVIGAVDAGEGVTIINTEANGTYHIEYNTFDGPMQGYISSSCADIVSGSGYGVVTTSSTTYYSPDGLHYAGAVSAGENIGVLCNNGSWAYIEYNVSNAMRKRAFIPLNCITTYSYSQEYFYHVGSGRKINVTSTITVYSGPNGASYPTCGSIDPGDDVRAYRLFHDKDGDKMWYVSYPTPSGTKYGYIYV